MQNGEKYANSKRSLELIALRNGKIHMGFQVKKMFLNIFSADLFGESQLVGNSLNN